MPIPNRTRRKDGAFRKKRSDAGKKRIKRGVNMDKNYWLKRWYERRFLNRLWEIYPDGEMSWDDILKYIHSGRFDEDLFSDISLLAEIELEARENNEGWK